LITELIYSVREERFAECENDVHGFYVNKDGETISVEHTGVTLVH